MTQAKDLEIFVFTFLPCILATNFSFLWPLKFEFGHQIFGVGGQLSTDSDTDSPYQSAKSNVGDKHQSINQK
jgi:hypothetical protein